MFVQRTVCELWALIYNAVEIKFTIVILLLEWPTSLFTQRRTGKHYTLINVHEQTESNSIFVVCFSLML